MPERQWTFWVCAIPVYLGWMIITGTWPGLLGAAIMVIPVIVLTALLNAVVDKISAVRKAPSEKDSPDADDLDWQTCSSCGTVFPAGQGGAGDTVLCRGCAKVGRAGT